MRQKPFAAARACLAAFALGVGLASIAHAADVGQLDETDPATWLVKSVCTDAANRVLPADPYGGCPSGAGVRKIRPGDPLPYHNLEQEGYQQRDTFPIANPLDGTTWLIATYDWQPFDLFNLYNGTDGYDVYALQGGWATIVNTSDGGGYGQAFDTGNCTVGDAWVLFPTQAFLAGGQATVPIRDVYWEQNASSYPGGCPTSYSTDTQTSWQRQTRFAFGGVNGNPTKTMDTLVSYHGFRATSGFLTNGQMEVNYFTREYGITRWEVWTPAAQGQPPTAECNVPASETYQGIAFVVTACHDWTHVTPAATAQIPVWPIPNIGLLAHAHFDGNSRGAWSAAGGLGWATAVSTAARDTANGSGVGYLRTGCGHGKCGGFSQALYQDLPSGSLVSGSYAFGINARSEAAGGASTSGTIAVAVEQLDGRGRVLWSDSVSAVVSTDNGTAPSPGELQSVYLSTAFVGRVATIALDPRAVKIRFLISPQTPQTFDVLDAWLAPWPLPGAFGAL